mmetsp:Transcript_87255/g.154589  ORF Transcript_87255/g.154589 Transcript_87255/m.154589 type:complete len:498 (+) Transcript_87255:60-1553(+)
MAASAENVPLPPGFEGYSGQAEDEVDPNELAMFKDFMGETKSSGGYAGYGDANTGGKGSSTSSKNGMGLTGEDTATVEVVTYKDEGAPDDLGLNLLDTEARFEDLQLSENLLQGIYETGFVKPSKIQAAALPMIAFRNGRLGQNMIGQAQNGSGKTATFSLAVLSAIDASVMMPQAIIICPTRELAKQNDAVISGLGKYIPVATQLVMPGQDRVPKNPQCHVLIGTPGKMMDMVKKRIIDVSMVRVFVLDEADMMLNQENQMGPQVTQVRRFLPADIQVLFFSATYPDDVREFAENLVPRAVSIKVRKTDLTVSSVQQMYMVCKDENDKLDKLSELYAAMNVSQSVVFVNQRKKAFSLAQSMQSAGHGVSLICGTQTQGEERMDPALRDKVMDEFRSGVTRVLIATDVLARGIDVPQVTLVVNYQMPTSFQTRGVDMETYLHRVGRTGRFGLRGIAVNLVTPAEKHCVDEVCSFFACKIPEMDSDFEKLEERLRVLR